MVKKYSQLLGSAVNGASQEDRQLALMIRSWLDLMNCSDCSNRLTVNHPTAWGKTSVSVRECKRDCNAKQGRERTFWQK